MQPLIEHATRAAGDTELVLLDGVGHCPQLEGTERLAELVLDFPGAVARAA